MKHHRYNQGWREANEMSRGAFFREWLAIAVAYTGAIGLMVLVCRMLAR